MKSLFGNLASGNLGALGSVLQNALGNATNTAGNAAQNVSGNLSNLGGSIKETVKNADMGSVSGLLGATAVGGLLGALFAGDAAKEVAKTTLTYGGTAAVGALAWNYYKKWSQAQAEGATSQAPSQAPAQAPNVQTQAPTPIAAQPQQATHTEEEATMILLEAMVYAARADGHIDETESANINKIATTLFPGQEIATLVNGFLTKPVDPYSLASKISNHEEGLDIYRLSCVAIQIDSFMERSYLDGLAKALNINDQEKDKIEKEALAIQEAMSKEV